MKIMATGHSLCHARQYWFFKKLAKLTEQVIVVGPRFWKTLILRDMEFGNWQTIGLPISNANDIFSYRLEGLEKTIERFKPDLIYCHAEVSSNHAAQVADICNDAKIPYAIFLWENIKPVSLSTIEPIILNRAKYIICGSQDASNLIPNEFKFKVHILPQVGLELDFFKPNPRIEKKYDIVFLGRQVSEKGFEIIKSACNMMNATLRIISDTNYEEIPAKLNECYVSVSLPVETAHWKEQSGSYANMESMACGLPVITTKCGAVYEYLKDSVNYCDSTEKSLVNKISDLVFSEHYYNSMVDAGLAHIRKFSNENIAKELMEIFNGKS